MNMRRSSFIAISGFAFALSVASLVRADDWPNWRGPHHNGISTEKGWVAKWPDEGPPQLWTASVGTGFSSVTVSRGRACTMGNQNDSDSVFCFDAESGKLIWKQSYPAPVDPHYYEGGPSATPTIDEGRVFTMSKKGDLFCYAVDDGKVIWSKNVVKDLGVEIPIWGFAGSALVQGKMLLLNVGTEGAALDKANGNILWTTGTNAAGYSTPLPCSIGGQPSVILMTKDGAADVSISSGRQLWRYFWKTDYGVNAADPVLNGTQVFISAAAAHTDALLQISGATAAVAWKNGNLQNQLNSSVLVDGFLYGVDGPAGPAPSASLKCIDWKTGSVKWSFDDVGGGSLMVSDHKIIALSDKGELFSAPISPTGFTPISRAQVLGGRCWTVPVLANGRIYCRNAKGDLVCLDVRPK
jgi:outer membrane protein assembly factor BamB